MNSITQVQNQGISASVKGTVNKGVSKVPEQGKNTEPKEIEQPVLNKMSKQLNENTKVSSADISDQQARQLVPNEGVVMMGAQSGNITAEFVANLLNKSPYES